MLSLRMALYRRGCGRADGRSVRRLNRLVRYVRGWMTNRQESRFAHPKVPAGRGTRTSRVNYFGVSDYYRPIPEIDSWIRRRIQDGLGTLIPLCRVQA